jgi:hypothetical protein
MKYIQIKRLFYFSIIIILGVHTTTNCTIFRKYVEDIAELKQSSPQSNNWQLVINIKNNFTNDINNISILEFLLFSLFNYEYDLIVELTRIDKVDLLNKKFKNLLTSITPNIPYAIPLDPVKSNAIEVGTPVFGAIEEKVFRRQPEKIEEDEIDLSNTKFIQVVGTKNPEPDIIWNENTYSAKYHYIQPYINANKQFKLIQPRHTQIQKKEVCALYSIVNAWVLEQLIKTGEAVDADAIFEKSKLIVERIYTNAAEKNEYLEGQIDPNQIFNKLQYFIEDESTQKEFKSHLNTLGIVLHKIFAQKETILPQEIQNTFIGTQVFFDSEDQQPLIPNYVNALKLYMLHNNKHIEHFICNTGGHWILISIVNSPGNEPTMYYIDSSGSPLDGAKRARINFILTLFNQFIENPVFT